MGPKTNQTTDKEIENPPQFKHPKLITLTKNLNKELAAEVENCWINPEKITTGNVLGNGTSFSNSLLFSCFSLIHYIGITK